MNGNGGQKVPIGGTLIGGHQGPDAQVSAPMLGKTDVERVLYQAAAELSEAKGKLLQVCSQLVSMHRAAEMTAEMIESGSLTVRAGGVHITAKQFAEKYKMVGRREVEALAVALERVQASAASVPVEVVELAARERRDG